MLKRIKALDGYLWQIKLDDGDEYPNYSDSFYIITEDDLRPSDDFILAICKKRHGYNDEDDLEESDAFEFASYNISVRHIVTNMYKEPTNITKRGRKK